MRYVDLAPQRSYFEVHETRGRETPTKVYINSSRESRRGLSSSSENREEKEREGEGVGGGARGREGHWRLPLDSIKGSRRAVYETGVSIPSLID